MSEEITRDSLAVARLEEQMRQTRLDIAEMEQSVQRLSDQMAALLEQMATVRGGSKVLTALFGAAAALGGLVSWMVAHVRWSP